MTRDALTPRVGRKVEFDAFGAVDVLLVREAEFPKPGPGEVLVRVAASSVNPKDTFIRKGRYRSMSGETFPMQIGYDYAGIVEAVVEGIDGLSIGDHVWGMANGWGGGCCADLYVAKVGELSHKPPELTMAEAAAIPLAALTALQALRDIARVTNGQRVVVNGASGGVGLFAVQIAKHFGAEVVAVASADNEALCRDHGADEFVSYVPDPINFPVTDIFFDVFGKRSFNEVRGSLAPDGIFVTTVPSRTILEDIAASQDEGTRRARLVAVRSNRDDLDMLAAMVTKGALRPYIDACYPIEAVGRAHAHVETRHTRGKVVVVADSGQDAG